MEVQLDMYQTLAASVLVLMLGSYLKQQIHVLEKFCIPAPGRRGDCYLQSSHVSVTAVDLWRSLLMIP